MEEDLRKKAELILGGPVGIPDGFEIPVRVSRSTAGPGAGTGSIVFAFHGMRVKKSIVRGKADFTLSDDGTTLYRNGETFIEGVDIQPVVFHCPEQAFFNLDQRCMFKCAYCTSPLLDRNATKGLTDEKIVDMIKNASKSQLVKSVALTSGVVDSVQATVGRMVSCVRKIRNEFPDTPIGVEPYIDSCEQIDALYAAGATEIKINCETATDAVFEKVCEGLDRKNILRMLDHAVEVFGKGKVASNIIVGLGETDAQIEDAVRYLASRGIAPGLRSVKINDINRTQIEDAIGITESMTSERLVSLGRMQKTVFEENGLDTRTFHTMCFECGCCDLVPFRDF